MGSWIAQHAAVSGAAAAKSGECVAVQCMCTLYLHTVTFQESNVANFSTATINNPSPVPPPHPGQTCRNTTLSALCPFGNAGIELNCSAAPQNSEQSPVLAALTRVSYPTGMARKWRLGRQGGLGATQVLCCSTEIALGGAKRGGLEG